VKPGTSRRLSLNTKRGREMSQPVVLEIFSDYI
jgi:hypothetical protein